MVDTEDGGIRTWSKTIASDVRGMTAYTDSKMNKNLLRNVWVFLHALASISHKTKRASSDGRICRSVIKRYKMATYASLIRQRVDWKWSSE